MNAPSREKVVKQYYITKSKGEDIRSLSVAEFQILSGSSREGDGGKGL